MELQKNINPTEQPLLISRIELGRALGVCPRVISRESKAEANKKKLPFVLMGKRKYYNLEKVLKHLNIS